MQALPWILAPAAALGAHSRLLLGLDLRGVPGAAGPELVHSVALGWTNRDLGTWTVGLLVPLCGGDPLLATRVTMMVSGVLAVLGIMLAAWSIMGIRAAVVACLVTALWSQTAFVWLMQGNDGMAWGLTWLGVGAAWAFARKGALGVVGVFPAALLALFGAGIRESGLPVAALLIMTPFLVGGRNAWTMRMAVVWILGVAVAIARTTFLAGHITGSVSRFPELSLMLLPDGLAGLFAMVRTQAEGLVIGVMMTLAAAGALHPSFGSRYGHWPQRALLGLLTFLSWIYVAEVAGSTIRPRYFTVPAFPLIILIGCASDTVQQTVEWFVTRVAKLPVRALSWLIPLALLVPLAQDNLGFLHAWSSLREVAEGARPAELPAPSEFWRQHYKRLATHPYFDVSAVGAINLFELGFDAPDAGAVIVPIRDAHEHHLYAGAAVAGKPAGVLTPMWCCVGERASAACARDVVADVDRAGVRLVLPNSIEQPPHPDRVDTGFQDWTRMLVLAAGGSLILVDPWWYVLDGTGSGGELPCPHDTGFEH